MSPAEETYYRRAIKDPAAAQAIFSEIAKMRIAYEFKRLLTQYHTLVGGILAAFPEIVLTDDCCLTEFIVNQENYRQFFTEGHPAYQRMDALKRI